MQVRRRRFGTLVYRWANYYRNTELVRMVEEAWRVVLDHVTE